MPTDPNILDDLSAGESLISLNAARHDRRLQIDGRSHDLSWMYRATGGGCRGVDGARVVLETIIQSGKKLTTGGAIERFVRRQAMGANAADRKPATMHQALAAHRAAKMRLAAAGI